MHTLLGPTTVVVKAAKCIKINCKMEIWNYVMLKSKISNHLCILVKTVCGMVTLACFRKRRKPSSSGRRISSAWPLPLMPLAVLPTLWMYSCGRKVKLKGVLICDLTLTQKMTVTKYQVTLIFKSSWTKSLRFTPHSPPRFSPENMHIHRNKKDLTTVFCNYHYVVCRSSFDYLGVIWGVVLDDPVHLRDVQPSSCHISTQQDAWVSVAELEEGGGTFGLLLLALGNRRRRNIFTTASFVDEDVPTEYSWRWEEVSDTSYMDSHDRKVDVVE